MKKRHFLSLLTLSTLTACSTMNNSNNSLLQSNASSEEPVVSENNKKIKIALALGGGASKGFAHIGVLKALEANGINAEIVTGTSAGAIVGSLYAYGMSVDRMELEAEILEKKKVADLTLSKKGFIVGKKLENFINEKVRQTPIQKFKKRFAAVATDLDTGKTIAFNNGNAGMAVRASASIPNVFQPVEIGGRRYVDGGMSQPVPVTAAKKLGADVVIAVDISARPKEQKNDGFFSFLNQSITIMSLSALEHELSQADVVIKPDVLELGSLGGFEQRHKAIAAGEKATLKVMSQIKQVIERKSKIK